MPLLKYSEVLAYSSEDPNHPVENLLKPDTYLKWKSKNGNNQKQEYAILKLDKLSTIKSIDIGNENSAFVEVLASREGTDYQVLLVASSFMTPLEARNGTNLNRVRMFGSDKLNKDVADQKWDRLKIICTQPFNKTCQYGLTFIKAYGPDDKASSDVTLGKYSLKEIDDDEEGSIEVGSFFEKRNQKEKESLVGSAAIRAASKASVITPQKRTLEDEVSSPSVEKQINKKHKASPVPAAKHVSKPEKPRTKEKESPPRVKPSKNAINSKKMAVRPFNQLMKDVVFVLSGYQNPKRSQLRDHLIAMGAKYKQDWEKGCTHLICAFKNTPKYTSVKGKGKIVKGDWVEECYKKKTRLPWRRFNLQSNKNDEESEEEILAAEICPTEGKKDAEEDHSHDSEDTDDELQRALDGKEKSEDSRNDRDKSPSVKQDPSNPPSGDEYGVDTDVDEDDVPEKKDTSSLPLPPLKSFLKGHTFFIYGNLDESKKKALARYITAFQGEIYDYMDPKVKYVLTDDSWDESFDEALNDNPSLQFVKSQWLWKCCDKEKFVPPQPFLIVPAEED